MVVRSQPLRCQIGGLCQHCSITTCSVSRVYLIMWAVWGQSNSSPATLHLCNGNFTPCCILMFYETAGSGWLSPASANIAPSSQPQAAEAESSQSIAEAELACLSQNLHVGCPCLLFTRWQKATESRWLSASSPRSD